MKQILILAAAVVGLSAPAALADCAGHVSAKLPVDTETKTASIILPETEKAPQSTMTDPTLLPPNGETKTAQ
ncbi:hypothetical protein SAMN05880582_101485 [Rhizobium sp. RU20A]|uniref:hypothetical protein n=1 Tax=Rhizobium sp. RU20A TaxID=1907412 RepID=UPI0009544936|nr:hypothetical protein [Rhizobium sp. RU20A]SIQ03743.1 hypothetical protein SAMN05880582_101485 [Rhizobium sp. RU20A]